MKKQNNIAEWAKTLTKDDFINAEIFKQCHRNDKARFMDKDADLYMALKLGLDREEFGLEKAAYINDMLAAMNLTYNEDVECFENPDEEFHNFGVMINGRRIASIQISRLAEIFENFAHDEDIMEECSEAFYDEKNAYKEHKNDLDFAVYASALGEYVAEYELGETTVVYEVKR